MPSPKKIVLTGGSSDDEKKLSCEYYEAACSIRDRYPLAIIYDPLRTPSQARKATVNTRITSWADTIVLIKSKPVSETTKNDVELARKSGLTVLVLCNGSIEKE